MPKVWLGFQPDGTMVCQIPEPMWIERRVQVEMNHSLYRQIKSAETKYHKFQDAMMFWLQENEEGRMRRISDGR
jgi:hypothetical protein